VPTSPSSYESKNSPAHMLKSRSEADRDSAAATAASSSAEAPARASGIAAGADAGASGKDPPPSNDPRRMTAAAASGTMTVRRASAWDRLLQRLCTHGHTGKRSWATVEPSPLRLSPLPHEWCLMPLSMKSAVKSMNRSKSLPESTQCVSL